MVELEEKLVNMNVCKKVCAKSSNSCGDASVGTKVVDLLTVTFLAWL